MGERLRHDTATHFNRRGYPPVQLPDPCNPPRHWGHATRQRGVLLILVVHFLHKFQVSHEHAQNGLKTPCYVQARQAESANIREVAILGWSRDVPTMRALHAKQMYVPIKPLEVVQSSLHNGDPFKGAGHVNLQLSLNEVQSYSYI